tara:strand:- start:131647 stop:132198 length:552 start_codon:yes stop_codon:yes gene_type:complete
VALIIQDEDGNIESTCCLCGEILCEPFYATSHFIADSNHPLFEFSDAPMHWSCYALWPDQTAFADLLFQTKAQNAANDELWTVIFQNQTALVTYGRAVAELDVLLRKSGSSFRVHRDNWRNWCESDWPRDVSHSLEARALSEALPLLKDITLPPRDLRAEARLSDLLKKLLKQSEGCSGNDSI